MLEFSEGVKMSRQYRLFIRRGDDQQARRWQECIAIVVGLAVLVFGLMRAAIRTAMLVLSVVVVLIGVLLLTRTL